MVLFVGLHSGVSVSVRSCWGRSVTPVMGLSGQDWSAGSVRCAVCGVLCVVCGVQCAV